jgi:Holliday junction resolvase RusA-like endonuclease
MTRRDRWAKRPCVLKYFEWAHRARLEWLMKGGGRIPNPAGVNVRCFFALTNKKAIPGSPHRMRPDADNVLKAVLDALFPKGDAMVYHQLIDSYWDDGEGPRVEIEVLS